MADHEYSMLEKGQITPSSMEMSSINNQLEIPSVMSNGSSDSRINGRVTFGRSSSTGVMALPKVDIMGDGASSPLGPRRGSVTGITLNRRYSLQPLTHTSRPSDQSLLARSLSVLATKQAKQKFSEQEKKTLSKFSSMNYAPTHSLTYMVWLKNYAKSNFTQLERWFLCMLIGVCTGLVASLLTQCTQALANIKWSRVKEYAGEDDLLSAWGWNIGISLLYIFISSCLVVCVHPLAAGGGTPEVIAFLNGIMVHGALGLKNLVVKFSSLVFSVSCGMAVGTQGPLISYGAIIGSGIGQFQSKTLGIAPKLFTRFRNAEDRREFTTAGVAAGVAAGFNAPMGGLLFAMEDLSSFWGKRLSWQVFFSAVVATATAQLFNTALNGFTFKGSFGLFKISLTEPIQIHVASLVTAVVLGLIGGLLGAFFTRANTFINRQRKKMLAMIKKDFAKKAVRVFECLILAFIMATYSVYLPSGFSCQDLAKAQNQSSRLLTDCYLGNYSGPPVTHYTCKAALNGTAPNSMLYNDVASVIEGPGGAYLKHLWSTGTHFKYTWQGCLTIFAIWYTMAIYTAGTAVAGGIFLPVVIGGALYGRALGIGMVSIWQQVKGTTTPINTMWDWMDPGLIAIMGSASLLGGVTRLSLATTVIIVEMSQYIDLVIPVMITIFVAKLVADLLSRPLFMYQLNSKLLPFLAQEPKVVVHNDIVELELYKACDVMASPVWTIHSTETVGTLARLLIETDHEGFPVVKYDEETQSELHYGLITRTELYVILCSKAVYDETKPGTTVHPDIGYEELSVDYIMDPSASIEIVKSYNKFPVYQFIYVDLEPFINMSAPKIDEDYSLHRTYQLFRTLGLRHLTVTDIRNRVVGLITRQDLLPYNMQEKLAMQPNGTLDPPQSDTMTSTPENSEAVPPGGGPPVSTSIMMDRTRRDSDNSLTLKRSSLMPSGQPHPGPKSGISRRFNSFATQQAKQNFSEQEKKTLSKFSSLNYAPTHSLTYMTWLMNYAKSGYLQLERWILCLLIGVCTGLVACLLKQCSQALGTVKWGRTRDLIQEDKMGEAFGWNVGMSIVYVVIASFFIAFIHPPAAGGGTPEVIAFLNGILVHGALGIKQLIVKFISLVFTVSSGLPAGSQGPLINFGAIIGGGVGQFQSKTLGFSPKIFSRFRNAENRREFTTAGVAAGVAAGFDAPMGGLLFAMEDLSSFWGKRIAWQTFFCATVATTVAQLFNAAFNGFQYTGRFGLFAASFVEPIEMHIASLAPGIVLGIVGGVLGALFTRLNTFINAQRKCILAKIKIDFLKKIVRMTDVLIIAIIMAAYSTYLPKAFPCLENDLSQNRSRFGSDCGFGVDRFNVPLRPYTCEQPAFPNGTEPDVYIYNDVASVIMGGGTGYLDHLWSTGRPTVYTWQSLLAVFAVYFAMTIYTPGCAVAGGIFLPVVITGALYGRALGVGMIAIWQRLEGTEYPIHTEWDWMDPGILAVMGSASMLGGVTRLSLATTVIIVEMSQDIDLIIPLMITNFVAKLVADSLSKPLFVYQLDSKLLPFMAQEPQVAVDDSIANLELYKARDVMASPVRTIHSTETVSALAKLLVDTNHEGFPVVKSEETTGMELAYGLITRTELYVILCDEAVYNESKPGTTITPDIGHDKLSADFINDPSTAMERVRSYTRFPVYNTVHVDLEPFINISAPKVDEDYSLHRTHQLFRTLGLRHLVVIDIHNQVVGMITRQDLLPFHMQERLSEALFNRKQYLQEYENNNKAEKVKLESGNEAVPGVEIKMNTMSEQLADAGVTDNGHVNQGFKSDSGTGSGGTTAF